MMNKRRLKGAVITWLAIYPSISLILWLFGEQLVQLPLLLRTFILTIVLVPLLAYVLVPLLSKVFVKWLEK